MEFHGGETREIVVSRAGEKISRRVESGGVARTSADAMAARMAADAHDTAR